MWRVQTRDDAQAFAELVGRWQEPIRRLCTRMVGDTHRAEDLTQETFARLFAHRQVFRADARFSTYLWRIAVNRCCNELRHRQARRQMHHAPIDGESAGVDALPSEQPLPDQQVAAQETAEVVRAALTQLPERYRTLLVLRHYENLKFREIAEVLDLPEGTVKTRMTEALNEMARRLAPRLELNLAPMPNRRARPRPILTL
jgi:RNA polymerase sigma-70 factor (ECF subfamily)